jgi:hypothetical protein
MGWQAAEWLDRLLLGMVTIRCASTMEELNDLIDRNSHHSSHRANTIRTVSDRPHPHSPADPSKNADRH